MSSTILNPWGEAELRTACQWGSSAVKPPGSARSEYFDDAASPWLRDVINAIPDNRYKELVFIAPTGAGKTTVFDVAIPRAIQLDPGSILQTLQNDAEADEYWEERLIPIIEGIESIGGLYRSLPRGKKKRGFIAWPHMSQYCSAAKWRALQRKSVRLVKLDEVWMMIHGFVAEARARTHDRWNQKVVLVSQGGERFIEVNGEFVKTELEEAWDWTDRNEYSMVCPDCGHIQQWCNADLLFENAENSKREIDERAILESARYKCRGRCGTEFEDRIDIKKTLSTGSIYVPTNPNHLPRHIGFRVHATALHHIKWGQLALEWKRANIAKRIGNLKPLKIYIQKRGADFWEEQEHRFSGFSSDAPESDYVINEDHDRFPGLKAGFPWEAEEERFLVGDYQELDGKYLVAAAAAFAKNGESRIIHASRINSPQEMWEKQNYLGISGFRVGIDCADNTADVNAMCIKYGWLELLGSTRQDWPHMINKTLYYLPFSPPERIGGVKNPCFRVSWSNSYYHDLHAQRLSHGGLTYGVPADIEDMAVYKDPQSDKPTGFWPQMRANHKVFKESKETGRKKAQWVRIGKRPDHYRDARCMLLVMANTGQKGNGVGNCLGEQYERERQASE